MAKPSEKPSAKPSPKPGEKPSGNQSEKPNSKPSDRPSERPSDRPRPSGDTATPTSIDSTNVKPRPSGEDANKKPGTFARPKPEAKPETKPEINPDVKPEPPLPPVPTAKRPTNGGDAGGSPELASDANQPSVAQPRPTQFVANEVFGVPVAGTTGGPLLRGDPEGGGNGNINNSTIVIDNSINGSTIYNDNRTYYNYINGVSSCNGWGPYAGWSSCGPCDWWQPYQCSDGLSISIGFGSGGFSFGFFYGSSCAPLCTSWCNPWWEGYASSWTCTPAYYAPNCRPVWCAPSWYAGPSWSWGGCWSFGSPWWSTYVSCGPCPYPAYTPCFAYSPVLYSSVVYTSPVVISSPVIYQQTIVTTPVPPAPPPLPNPSDVWAAVTDGADDAALRGFADLAAADPAESSWLIGRGFTQAFQGDTAWASDTLREAMRLDASGFQRTWGDPRFVARLEALERSLSPLAGGRTPWVDALLVTAASQAARGDLAGAFFTATTAQAEGDRSMGTAAFVRWLQTELRGRI